MTVEMKNKGKILKPLLAAVLLLFTLWGMAGCTHRELHLHDCYFITRDGEWGEGWFLESNPGYPLREGISRIDNLKSVAWNSRLIVVEQQFPGTDAPNVWWIVAAAGEELKSGNDTLLGPFTPAEKDAWLRRRSVLGKRETERMNNFKIN